MNSGRLFKKNKHCEGSKDRNFGDRWIYTAIRSDSLLFLAQFGGKRTDATCTLALDRVFTRLQLPTPSNPIIVATDGNAQYASALAQLYCEPCIEYGRVIKQREANRLVGVIREKSSGNPAIKTISTSIVEGLNNKIRQRLSRFGRKTASFSKRIMPCIRALNVLQFVSNFIERKGDETPAMKESITDHAWTWREFIRHHIQL